MLCSVTRHCGVMVFNVTEESRDENGRIPYNTRMKKFEIVIFLLTIVLLSSACANRAEQAVPTATATTIAVLPTETATAVPSQITTTEPPTVTAVPSPTPIPPTPTPAFPIYEGTPLDPAQMGIQLHLRDENQEEIFAHLQALGFGWVKVQISWKLYEPYAGEYHPERFAELDRFVDTAVAHNINVLLGVSKAPEWSRPTTEMDGPPNDFALYQQFMAYLANRYNGKVAAYELWNEPNLQREWNGFTLSGAELTNLIRFGAAGVRQHDANAILVAGAPAVTGIDDRVNAIADRTFLHEMLAAGVADFVDAIGVHPYGHANPPDSTLANPDPNVPSHNNHPTFFFADTMQDYRQILTEAGTALPLWATEFGWGSYDGFFDENKNPIPPIAGVEYMGHVSEWQQAEYTARAFELAQADGNNGPFILWNLNFGPLLGTDFSETGYSLLRPDGSRRPIFMTMETAVNP